MPLHPADRTCTRPFKTPIWIKRMRTACCCVSAFIFSHALSYRPFLPIRNGDCGSGGCQEAERSVLMTANMSERPLQASCYYMHMVGVFFLTCTRRGERSDQFQQNQRCEQSPRIRPLSWQQQKASDGFCFLSFPHLNDVFVRANQRFAFICFKFIVTWSILSKGANIPPFNAN